MRLAMLFRQWRSTYLFPVAQSWPSPKLIIRKARVRWLVRLDRLCFRADHEWQTAGLVEADRGKREPVAAPKMDHAPCSLLQGNGIIYAGESRIYGGTGPFSIQ